MPGPVGKSADEAVKSKSKSKRGQREDKRLAELATVNIAAEVPLKPPLVKNDKIANEHWDYLSSMLLNSKLLAPLDGPCLSMMCMAYSRWQKSEEKISDHLVKDISGGGQRVSVYVKIAKESMSLYYSYAEKFGMTPQARAKLRLPLPKTPQSTSVNATTQQSSRSRFYGPGV